MLLLPKSKSQTLIPMADKKQMSKSNIPKKENDRDITKRRKK